MTPAMLTAALDPALPISTVLPELVAQLARTRIAVVQAAPGAGKSTQVPLALLAASWLGDGGIVMLEPRRLAARAVAARMAELCGEALGETIGYRVRFENKISARTRVEVVTEGILARRLQHDPALDGVRVVILDEFHERHLQTDLALALVRDIQRGLREDLRLVIMSATVDAAALAARLRTADDASDITVVTSAGRSYPVTIHYQAREPQGDIAQLAATTAREALAAHAGDVLVFLPGAGEIRAAQRALANTDNEFDVHALYGDLSLAEQDRALRPVAGRRKIILSTPIAETSLTIAGVGVVVDSGWMRTPRFDARSGLTRLETVRVSQASAAQRAGRAGRVGPGVCYRLWTETIQRGLVAQAPPEIAAADLAPLALELAQWGADVQQLLWLDPPPAIGYEQGRALLRTLGALDARNALTATGRAMAALPLHPRLACMAVAAPPALLPLACDVAALLSERDLFRAQRASAIDLRLRCEALAAFRRGAAPPEAERAACAQVARAAQQYRRLLSAPSGDDATIADNDSVGVLLAFAYPDRIAQRRRDGDVRYLLANGRGVRLPPNDALRAAEFLVAPQVELGSQGDGTVYLAAPISLAALRTHFATRCETVNETRWDAQQQAVLAQCEERLGALVLSVRALAQPDAEASRACMLQGIRSLGAEVLPWTPEARAWQARVQCMRSWFADEAWPDVSDAGLWQRLEAWLGPYLDQVTRRAHLARLDLATILRAQLDWPQQRRLDEAAPTHLTVPSGSRVAVQYTPDQPPVLAVKLQELFGLADTPRVALGKIPVSLHLLSPARRPIQITQDLRGFWERTYPEVKKELKGRYPRHPWPDDPWSATPTARAHKRPRS